MIISNTNTKLEQEIKDGEAQEAAAEKQEMDAMCRKHNATTVFKCSIPKDDTYKTFLTLWLKKPSRTAISLSMSMEERDPLQGKEIILRDCLLEGDDVFSDLDYFLSACTIVDQLTTIRRAALKKNSISLQ
jgi:hypothetical protein